MGRRKRTAKVIPKTVLFLVLLLPLGGLVWKALQGDLGANPIEALNRSLGDAALHILLLSLAVTPLRKITGWNVVQRYRRMIGLFAFFYVFLHLSSYIGLDHFFDWSAIGAEIIKRRYITLGMVGAVILLVLALTSSRGAIRRLGGQRWRRLHQMVYLAAVLGVVHHAMMVKADLRAPLVHAGILALLLGYRLYDRFATRPARR